jgi:tryptophan synthase alpha chain
MRLARTFASAKAESRGALITYVMGGDPTPQESIESAMACIRGGADIVELGFPFSDPIADGPTIQRAAERALAGGVTLESVLKVAASVRAQSEQTPLVLMGYLNPVLAMGVAAFFTRAAESGVDAVILPDLPPEEAAELRTHADRTGVSIISMLAPTSTAARRAAVLKVARGFTYFVAVTGVTGTRTEQADISAPLATIRAESNVPVVVGFGISTPGQAHAAAQHADGVVVGSALVERIARHESLEPFVASLRAALHTEVSPCSSS